MIQILHLGLGRFHRGHQAVYYQRAGDCKVISSTMRSTEERDKLRKVALRYPVLELSHNSVRMVWIDCIQDALSLTEDFTQLVKQFTSPKTSIVTLTVTEKGYCLGSDGKLDLQHPGIVSDLRSSGSAQTAIGFIARCLADRKEKLTIISCDNLRSNGEKLRDAVMAFMNAAGVPTEWARANVTFPNTMVDRIVPALLPEKVAELEKQHDLKSSELVATETFSQWVIEDKFSGPRPSWERVGVQFVDDVRPYEEMKLRLLNASHSFLAYAGINRGFTFVHEAIADESLHQQVMNMLETEVVPLLEIPGDFDVTSYIGQLMQRFRNDKLPHQLKQIAMDGSQKMPQRIFSSIAEARRSGKSHKLLDGAVDEWLTFLWNSREKKIDDPKAEELIRGISEGENKWKTDLRKRLGV